VIAGGDGKAVEFEADYFPFGNIEQLIINNLDNSYRFTGYEYDFETGYNYANFREQSPRTGRFLSVDPVGADITNPQSLNRYAYVLNNPTNLIGPLGLVCTGDPGPGEWCGSYSQGLG